MVSHNVMSPVTNNGQNQSWRNQQRLKKTNIETHPEIVGGFVEWGHIIHVNLLSSNALFNTLLRTK